MLKTSINRLRGGAIFEKSAAQAEQLFLAPPFTKDVVKAIRAIATRLPIAADEASRLLCQQESNAACQSEYAALRPVFQGIKPRRILEIGPGFGRSVVYFQKKGVWGEPSEIHLYDADGTRTKYKQKHYALPPQWPDTSSYCGNLSLLKYFLEYNGVRNYQIFNAAQRPLHSLPGPYDLIYGFYSIGFHWSLEFYLHELAPLLHEKTVFICTLNKRFRPFPQLHDFSTRVLECHEIKKGASSLRLLLLSKGELPSVGMSLREVF